MSTRWLARYSPSGIQVVLLCHLILKAPDVRISGCEFIWFVVSNDVVGGVLCFGILCSSIPDKKI